MPAATSLADSSPPTPTADRLNAAWISGSTTMKLCTIQWNTTCPEARPGMIVRPPNGRCERSVCGVAWTSCITLTFAECPYRQPYQRG